MQKYSIRFNNEDDVRSQRSHYTNVSNAESEGSKNVELSLEVEVDDEVRNIIKHPEKCPSALLDVTVIKPKGLDQYTSKKQVLKGEQVKKLIQSMQLDNVDKKDLMERLFGPSNDTENEKEKELNSSPKGKKRKSCISPKTKSSRRQTSASIGLEQGDVQCIADGADSTVFSMYNQSSELKELPNLQRQQIFTTPRTHENIRRLFECKKTGGKNREDDKPDQPCLCQNCAIVGILADSQKKPFATEPMLDPLEGRDSRFRRPARKKSVSFKHADDSPPTGRSHDQCQAIFKLLSARISELEKRILRQEEKAVPRDYFKKIITKLVNHLSKLTHYTTDERNTMTSHRQKNSPYSSTRYKSSDPYNRFYVNPVLLDNNYRLPAEKELDPKPCSSSEPSHVPSESIWKWGEDFLTSGRDLKNKVMFLLEDTLHNLKKGWEKPQKKDIDYDDVQSIVDELSKNLAKTINLKPAEGRDTSDIPVGLAKPDDRNNNENSNREKKSKKPSLIPRLTRKKDPTVNVAYVNPQLTGWPKESLVSFKIDTSDYESHREMMSEAKKKQYKKEFLKILENTKKTDKFKLWQNIWNQAVENRQNYNDTVTIQIPDPQDLLRQKMIKLEYSIGELERLLVRDRRHQEETR